MCLLVTLLLISTVSGKVIFPPLNQGDGNMEEEPSDLEDAVQSWPEPGKIGRRYEGDMILDSPNNEEQLWPNGVVPYVIPGAFSYHERLQIIGAMREIENATCIRFLPRKYSDEAVVNIHRLENACWSSIGYGLGSRYLNLGKQCMNHGTIIHELLHTLGMRHQHTAPNRDDFITMHEENIRYDTKCLDNFFNKGKYNDYGVGYDYNSIMHYRYDSCSKNGKDTMTPKDKSVIIQREKKSLTQLDTRKLNIMYKCYDRRS